MSELIEEEVSEDAQPTEEETYDAEYEKAWGDEESTEEVDTKEEELEQPNTEDETTDETVEEEVVEDSNETEEGEEKAEKSEEVPSEDFAEVLKWKGKEIPVTREELIALGQKGFDSEKKWQEAAVNRPLKEVIDKYGLTVEQLTILGNISTDKSAEALALLAEQNGIDLFEAEKKDYQPVVEEVNYELNDVISEINENEEIANQMNDYVSSVPQSVKDLLTTKPDVLRGLNQDMKQGIAQKIMPEVIKQLAINSNQDFIKLYQGIGQSMFSQLETKAEEVKEVQQPKSTREDKKRVAVSKKTPAPEKKIADDYDAAWGDDAHFEAVKRRLSGF